MKSLAFGIVLVALVGPIYLNWIDAQKTIKKSFQQQISSQSTGQQPNSIYGGYDSASQTQQKIVSPARQSSGYSSSSSSSSSSQVLSRPSYQQTSYEASSSEQSGEADSEPASYGSVNGQPGVDFPAYTRIPKTSFSCEGVPYEYGMYADEETGCQAYHLCYNGRKDSFLCGVGTVFNQRILHCDYWYSVDCGKSSQYYSSNAYMGSAQPEPGPAQASGSVQSSYKSRTSSSSPSLQPIAQSSNSYSKTNSQQWSRNTQEKVENY